MKVFNQFACQLRLEFPFFNTTLVEIAHNFGKVPLGQVFFVPPNAFIGTPLYNNILYNAGLYGALLPVEAPPLLSLFDYERVDSDANNITITFTSLYTGLVVLLA